MKKDNSKKAVIFFIAAITVTFILRFVQIIMDVDKSTGQLHSSAVNGIFAPLTLGVILVTGILLYALSSKAKTVSLPSNRIVGIASLMVSFTAVYDAVSNYFSRKNEYAAALSVGITKAEVTTFELLGNIAVAQIVLALLAALYFFVMALCIFRDVKKSGNFMSFLSVSVPLWCCIRLAVDYIELTNASILTEKIYDSLTICAMALFFMANIRVFSDISRGNTVKFMTATGLLTVITAIIFPIPRYLFILFADYKIEASAFSFNLVNFAVAFYIIAYLTNCFEQQDLENEVLQDNTDYSEETEITETSEIIDAE